MALRSDFRTVSFYQHLGDDEGDLNVSSWTTFKGNQTDPKHFTIDGNPVGDAYLLLNTYDVEEGGHDIKINGAEAVVGADIPPHPGEYRWQTWLGKMNTGVLKSGDNTIQIFRGPGGDNFVVGNVAIHWRESD